MVCFTAPQDRKVREMVKIEPCKETGGKKNTDESQIKMAFKKVPRSFFVDVPYTLTNTERVRLTRMDQFTHVCTEKLPTFTLHTRRSGNDTCTNNKLN